MTADPPRVDTVAGQVPLPGMPEDGVLFHVERPAPARVQMCTQRDAQKRARRAS